MDKVKKALRKLTEKERKIVKNILEKVNKEVFNNLDIKKLKGYNDIFRIRKRDIRIIFRKTDKGFFILSIERRTEKTYKKF